ncbi:O-antigen ligase family protein [Pedobacter namyangjuensis]|uniref:O-antigen ligase family protein n=1 Tax=Pedobacter namyangjuensis TaxID=600626 RepID=UPI000DE51424|nr:O-antigen ligase family protein [Pedobacter namyangjuensis]
MSKKEKKRTLKSSVNINEKKPDTSNVAVTIIIAFYMLVECMPRLQLADQMGIHWLLISVLNGFSLIYLISNKSIIESDSFTRFFKNGISVVYTIFFLIAGLSLFVAINPIEGLVAYSRLFTTILSFVLIGILLINRLHLLKNIALIITIIATLQGFETVLQFYREVGKTPIDTLIYNLQGTSGNKNIFAAAFVIKIPFIIYCIFSREGFLKFFSIIGLSLCFLSLFLINARSAFIGVFLSLIILFATLAYLYWKDKKLKFFLVRFSFIVLAFALPFFISQQSLKNATQDKSSTYGTVASRIGGIAEQTSERSNIRLAYWKGSYELIKERPIIGVGYGNWKIYAPLYTKKLLNDDTFSKHPHNDFIEIGGETGVINALVFLSIFVIALILSIKIILGNGSFHTKIIAGITFACLTGYFIDAMFNFPAERPNIQILFALSLAILVANWLSTKQVHKKPLYSRFAKSLSIAMLVTCIGAVYVNAMVFKSSKVQVLTDNDFVVMGGVQNTPAKYTFEEVTAMYPKIPNIGENSETIGFKKARYLYAEKRYAEAIKLLDSVLYQSPNIGYSESLKSKIYADENKLDSAYKYGKIAFYAKPRYYQYYRTASYFAMVHKDVPEVEKLFKTYNSYRQDQASYSYYTQSLFYSNYDKSKLSKIVSDGLKKYPTDTIMLELKRFLH